MIDEGDEGVLGVVFRCGFAVDDDGMKKEYLDLGLEPEPLGNNSTSRLVNSAGAVKHRGQCQ